MVINMKKTRLISIVLICIILTSSLPLTSCGGMTKFTEYSLDSFDTATSVTGYATDRESFDAVFDEINSSLNEYHRLYDIYTCYEGITNLCRINSVENGVHPRLQVDRRIIDLLLYAKEMYNVTGGKLNVAMGSVLSLWHRCRTEALDGGTARLPTEEELKEASVHTDIECLIIDEEKNTVWISDPHMTLDVGAVAKGYAVEMVAQSLEEQGITGYVINAGGNVRTVGAKPDGEKWTVGIENPDGDADAYFAYLYLAGESVVTSGSYQRFYKVDGESYHHIIDPDTLMPAEGFLSVSVICKSSAMGDALSTALFSMTYEEGASLAESLDGVEVHWVTSEGIRMTSSGFDAYSSKP